MDVSIQGAVTVDGGRAVRGTLDMSGGRLVDRVVDGFRMALHDHLVFPALVNAHEHLQVNGVPPLPADRTFANSYDWIEAFQAHFHEPSVVQALAVPKAMRLRQGALKNLLAGTTCVAHHDPWHGELDAADFPIALLRDHGWSYTLNGPDFGPAVRESFLATSPQRPWMIHLAEGTDARAASELAELDAMGCLASNCVLVHGVGLRDADIDRIIACGAAVVWCPQSNRRLLGRSIDPRRLHAAGRLALGSDSRLSGSRDLLDEMAAAAGEGIAARGLIGLATADAARILRMADRGGLHAGAMADLIIVADRGASPEGALVGLRRADLRAVVREGVPVIADPDFAPWFDAAGVEPVAVQLDGHLKLLDPRLADPALLALEPGLELARAPMARIH